MTNGSCEYSQLLNLEQVILVRINEVEREILDLNSKWIWRWKSSDIQAEKEAKLLEMEIAAANAKERPGRLARISELLNYKSRLLSSLKVIRKKIKNIEMLLDYVDPF